MELKHITDLFCYFSGWVGEVLWVIASSYCSWLDFIRLIKPANTTLSRKCSERILIFPGWEVHIWFHCCGVCIPLKWSICRLWIPWKNWQRPGKDFTFSSDTKRSLCILNLFYTCQKLLTVLMGNFCCWLLNKTKQNKTAHSLEVESWGYISCWFWSFKRAQDSQLTLVWVCFCASSIVFCVFTCF